MLENYFSTLLCRLYQLDRDFNVIANVTTGPIPDHHNCIPQADSTKPCPEKEWTNNTNKLLLIDKNQSRLIACGSVVQVIFCILLNSWVLDQ